MSQRRPSICVVGSANMDLTFRALRLPRPGETLSGQSFQTGFGGKGANQAVMAARLGARVSLIARVGRDAFGDQTVRHYQQQGIDTTHVRQDADAPTGVASIVVDDAGQNCILIVAGANGRLSPDDVRSAASVIESSDLLLAQLEVPLSATLEAFRLARASGVRTILNPAPAVPLPDELFSLTDICIPNETEAEILTGRRATPPTETESAVRKIQNRGPNTVLVTLGAQGVVLVDGQTVEHIPAVSVTALDATGAGDAFIGSLAVFLLEGMSLSEAARRANAAAALSVTRPGTQASFPNRSEIETILKDKP